MKKVLVHLHVYYHDQVDYFIDKLKNINGVDWDLVVTFSEKNDSTISKIRNFKPDSVFSQVENIGYDIWPFINLIQTTDLSQYDYVIKLHTKRSVSSNKKHSSKTDNFKWRNSLVDTFLFDPKQFTKVLDLFENDKRIGMISSKRYFLGRDFYDHYVLKELNNIGLSKINSRSCMGSMFMARASVFAPLKHENIVGEKFKDSSLSGTSISYSHIYERILSHLPANYGLIHKPLSPTKKESFLLSAKNFSDSIFKFIFCIERQGPARNKTVSLMGLTVYRAAKGKYEEDAEKLKRMFHE